MSNKIIKTPDLCDEFPSVKVVEPIGFKNYGKRKSFGGEIVTVKCFEDNSMVRDNVAKDGKGKVLVVDGGGSLKKALLGDLLAEKASLNKWEGIIINGCIRDVDEIAVTDLGVQALNSIPMKTEKLGLGDVNISITFGGVTFIPGEFVYADNNGIIVSQTNLLN